MTCLSESIHDVQNIGPIMLVLSWNLHLLRKSILPNSEI